LSFGLVPIHPNGLSGGQLTDNFQLAVIVPIMVWDWHAITRSCPMDSFFSIAGAFFFANTVLWELGKNIVPFSVFVRYISKSTKQEMR